MEYDSRRLILKPYCGEVIEVTGVLECIRNKFFGDSQMLVTDVVMCKTNQYLTDHVWVNASSPRIANILFKHIREDFLRFDLEEHNYAWRQNIGKHNIDNSKIAHKIRFSARVKKYSSVYRYGLSQIEDDTVFAINSCIRYIFDTEKMAVMKYVC